MIDMLGLCSQENINSEKISQLKILLGLTSQGVPDTHYLYTNIFKKHGEHFFTLKSGPRLPNLRQSILLINPSRFENFHEMKNIIETIFSDELIINRVDFCSDIYVPIREVEAKLKVKSKKISHSYTEGIKLTGISFGSQNDITVVYDKAFLLKKERERKLTKKKGIPQGVLTRIEVRKKGNKVPFPNFSNLEKYLDYNPFKQIELLDCINPENLRATQAHKAIWAMEQVQLIGFHSFRRQLNKNSNFSKTWAKLFTKSNLNQVLLKNYRKNLSTFFKEEAKIHNSALQMAS